MYGNVEISFAICLKLKLRLLKNFIPRPPTVGRLHPGLSWGTSVSQTSGGFGAVQLSEIFLKIGSEKLVTQLYFMFYCGTVNEKVYVVNEWTRELS